MAHLMTRFRVEDPERILTFRLKLEGLSWDAANSKQSLLVLFSAMDDLATSEVQYYYRRRGTRAFISGAARTGAWILGSIGLILPLLPPGAMAVFKEASQYGYAFLAGAASCLAANSLFGGTEGHIRFVSTQLELERLITAARVEWCHHLATPSQPGEFVEQGFKLILAYATALHAATLAETGRWGETLMAELAKFQKTVEARKGSGA